MNNAINTLLATAQEKARIFLTIADENERLVSAYLNGCNAPECAIAYEKVIEANRAFNEAEARLYDEPVREPCLDYQAAESILPELWED